MLPLTLAGSSARAAGARRAAATAPRAPAPSDCSTERRVHRLARSMRVSFREKGILAWGGPGRQRGTPVAARGLAFGADALSRKRRPKSDPVQLAVFPAQGLHEG